MGVIQKRGAWVEAGNKVFVRCPECGKIAPFGACNDSRCPSGLKIAKMLLIAASGDGMEPLKRPDCPDGFRIDGRFLEYYCNDRAGSTHLHRMAI